MGKSNSNMENIKIRLHQVDTAGEKIFVSGGRLCLARLSKRGDKRPVRYFRKGDSFPTISSLATNLKQRILSLQYNLTLSGFIAAGLQESKRNFLHKMQQREAFLFGMSLSLEFILVYFFHILGQRQHLLWL